MVKIWGMTHENINHG